MFDALGGDEPGKELQAFVIGEGRSGARGFKPCLQPALFLDLGNV